MILPSKELKGQMTRLGKTGSFRLSMTLKEELRNLTVEYGVRELVNLSCGSCLRMAMHDVKSYLDRLDSKPVLSMTMEKKPTEMSYHELRRHAKAKGIKTGKNPTKNELIKLLS